MTHFPDQPHDGQQVVDELQEPPGYIRVWTYSEAKNEWTYKDYGPGGGGVVYTDQVVVRDNAEVPGLSLADPSTLMTQKEVNYWLDEKASQGGGGGGTPGKETLPWLQINKWGMRKNPYSGNPIYEVSWSNNPNCTYTWQYEIDGEGNDNWVDIADHPQKEELGYTPGGEFPIQLSLGGSNQADILPDALMRFRITGELNGIMSELSSGVIAAWEERMDEYNPPLYEAGIAADLDPYATTEYVDDKVEEYLRRTGGTQQKMEGILYLGGHKIAGVAAPELATDAANKQYVDGQIAAIPAPEGGGGGFFTEEYNGNRFYKAGLETTGLEEGEVMFLSSGVTTEIFAAVTHVALPEAGIDWTKFTNMGTIEVRNGETVCGHLQVVSAQNNPGRNWKVKVKVLDIVENELDPETGHPCYFWGMFTG